MVSHLDQKLRERIIIWRYEHNKTGYEIAGLAGCSERTVFDVLRLHCDFGQVTNPHTHRIGRPRILDQGDLSFLTSILDANPSLYLDEIQERLFEARNRD
ncbi:hypothetical protein JAAARDRAFT_111064, partial [Jaapia argillacea MUCL 33604]